MVLDLTTNLHFAHSNVKQFTNPKDIWRAFSFYKKQQTSIEVRVNKIYFSESTEMQ